MIKPRRLAPGDTIGVFTPSSPSYISNEELFSQGLLNLKRLGFKVKLGDVTARRGSEGYRSASPEERARELMELIADHQVHAVMSTIGGNNSSSLIGYLDFDLIREKRKLMCGYSDVTSLHLAIQKFSGLSTVYGPAVMCWFGDWPDGGLYWQRFQYHRRGRLQRRGYRLRLFSVFELHIGNSCL